MYKNIHNYRICLFIVSLELWNWIGIFGQINFSNSENNNKKSNVTKLPLHNNLQSNNPNLHYRGDTEGL